MSPQSSVCFRWWSILPFILHLSGRAASAQCGTRFVSKSANASDTADPCDSAATPCATINYAILQACAGDTVTVGEGTWVENVVIDRRW
jgi:hypothetical protein